MVTHKLLIATYRTLESDLLAIKYITLSLILITFYCSSATADVRPEVLKQIMKNKEDGIYVTYLQNLSEDEKKFYWTNTTRHSDGYFKFTASSDFMDLIDNMYNISKKMDTSSNVFSKKNIQKNTINILTEGPNRLTYFIESNYGLVMLTIWNFVADEAKIFIANDFLNIQTDELTGTLTLASAEQTSNKCIWQLSWISKSIQYELTLPDKLNAQGEPFLNRKTILDFVKNSIAQ